MASSNFWTDESKWMPVAYGLMGLGGGMLRGNTPGATFGQAFGAGVGDAQQALMTQQLLSARTQKERRQREQEEAARRQIGMLFGMPQAGPSGPGAPQRQGVGAMGPGEAGQPPQGNVGAQGPGILGGMTPQQRMALQAYASIDPMGAMDKFATQAMKPPEKPQIKSVGGGWLVKDGELTYDPRIAQSLRGTAAAGRSTVSVNQMPGLPNAPAGYAYERDPSGAVRLMQIPGGPAALETQAAEGKSQAAQAQKKQTADIVVQEIDRALATVGESGWTTAGPIGAVLSNISGTPAHDVSKLVETIRANIGFDTLQSIRAASPTGGALGPVSDTENRLLQSTMGNLEQSQTPEQFKRNLERVKEVYLDVVHGPGNRPAQGTAPTTQSPRRLKFNPATGELE